MKTIATLTMNPAIDVAYQTDRIVETEKIRAREERYDPGGGGINVARVIARLGGTARAHYLSGGATGATFDNLLDVHEVVRSRIPIAGNTRISTSVFEAETGKEFRFVPKGPVISQGEWQACLDHLSDLRCDYLVASGSLPLGVPDDFYNRVRAIAQARGIAFVLDSSGTALQQGMAGGGLLLIKPSLDEFRQLIGKALATPGEIAAAAIGLVHRKLTQYVAVTMSEKGAIFAQESGAVFVPAVDVEVRGTVGAGDSFLAAMMFSLACDRDPIDAFRYGMAAGAAALLSPGTDLCHFDDIERMYRLVAPETPVEIPA
jgi:6-phosphofructokinase 2